MNLLLNTHINSEGSVDGDSNHHAVHHQSRSIKYDDHDSDGAETKLEEGDTTWIPPEAADKEHDDDDDDDINWGSEPSPSPREAERQRAMLKAMNGQLKVLVTRFLASAGISLPHQGQDGGESWLDIVTSLSWEAALLIKPHATVGKEMDPGSYIKFKRVASGTHRQCEVIEGLVFKKNVAHKHMPTKCHNPNLLLIRGALGDSDIGLSSFDSMEQDKDLMEKVISQVMEICSPNVIMVEKTVSRDVLELLLKEGVTLVLDMKLDQLERIARCSGSPIISFSDVLSKPKLKQCDYFHIEKFVEEHNHTGEGGKRPSKTLMFLEGFLKPLGCTILLRGASSEELKKVKQVMHYTVFAAYHLVLETSFFEDQRVFLNNRNTSNSKEGNFVGRKEGSSIISHETPALSNGYLRDRPTDNNATNNGALIEFIDGEIATVSSANPDALNSPADSFQNELPEEGAIIHYDSNHALPSEKLLSSVSGSLRGFIDIFHHQNIYLPVTSSQETIDHQEGGRLEISQEIPSKGFHVRTKVEEPVDSVENITDLSDLKKQVSTEANQQRRMDDDSISGEHEKLSVPLENVVHHNTSYFSKEKASDIDETYDVLDSQSILILMSSQCITNQVICEQSHLSRIKYYGNFDVSLGRYLQDILQNQNLSCSSCGEPPEAHMYSYTHRDGNLTVLVKRLPPQHRLPGESEGKIWMWTRCLRCEHESGISKSSRRVLLSTEARNLSFGKFLELSFSSHSAARKLSICGHLVNRDCLRFFGLGSLVAMLQYSSVEIYTACTPQPTLEFHNADTRELFEQERRNVLARGVTIFSEVASLLQHIKNQFPEVEINYDALFPVKEFSQLEEMLIKEKGDFVDSLVKAFDQCGMPSSSVHELLDVNWLYQDLLLELYVWDRRLHQLVMGKSAGEGRVTDGIKKVTPQLARDQTTIVAEADDIAECRSSELSFQSGSIEPVQLNEVGMNGPAPTLVDENPRDKEQHSAEMPWSEPPDSLDVQDNRILTRSIPIKREPLGISELDDRERWVWSPLYESKLAYRQEVEVACLENFELVNHYFPSHLSPLHLHKQSAEDVCSPRFIVGPGGNVLCVAEDEISSTISCALAISEDRRHLLDDIVESEAADTSYSLSSEGSSTSSSWSSIGSSDSEASFSTDDLYSYDSSLSSPSLHPEISVNGRVALKGKYSVICVHANQFYTLRKKCCPSELAYITSLSRCKKWDAQGGKSKAFFAKTMDGRFIIKQIKKTEFESSIEFAPDYFKHVYHSLDTGSPTCLAKILGIYQVKQIRHSKEVKIDLMVMENLLFGQNVSRTYDLKGAVYSRYVTDSSDCDTVYLDQNFVEDMRVSPIYIGARTKHLLQRAIWNDTSFLTSINVTDYSLLVGVNKENREFVFGIIDYLRQYTWDKQLETWVKASLVVPKNVLPTVISPREYKKRFRKFMAKYFLTVPDDWSTKNRPGSCKSCAHSNCKLPEVNNEKPGHQIEACA